MDKLNQEPLIEEKVPEIVPEVVPEVESEALKAFLGEEVKGKEEVSASVEEPKEEPVLPQETPTEEPTVPLEEIIEEVKAKTREEVKAEILKGLGITAEEKKVAEEKGFKFPWEKRGEDAPATWLEHSEGTLEFQEFRKAEKDKVTIEQQKQELFIAKEREVAVNTEWDAQLDYLRSEGLIPEVAPELQVKIKEGKILTKQEREDPGLKAQSGIFETMYTLSQERELLGQSPLVDIVHVFNRYYKPTKKPAGAAAPVSGGSTPTAKSENEDISYGELHAAKGFEDLL